jgi:hypothetical protein
MFRRTRQALLATCVLAFAPPAAVLAQEPASSLGELQHWVRIGDRVALTDANGRKVTGSVAALKPESVALAVEGQPPREFPQESIRTITRREPDSLRNGALIGLGVGVGFFGLAFAASNGCEYESNCAALVAVGAAFYGGMGAAIGVGIDAIVPGREMVIFRREVGRVRLGVSPRLAPGRQAVVMSLAF